MNASEFFLMSGIEKQASKIVYRKFAINRHELNMLVGLSAYLMLFRKKIISRDGFTNWLGLNYGLEKRCFAYLKGLVDKGALHRLSYNRPDGNCLAISGFGIEILKAFDQALNELESQNPLLSSPSYRSVELDLNNLPKGYVIRQEGRQS